MIDSQKDWNFWKNRMKKRQLLTALVMFPLHPIFDAVAADEISVYAMEMNVKRINEVIFRYTRFNSESPYPCLRLELISPQKHWKVVDRKDMCEMNGKDLGVGYSYSGFDSFVFKEDGITFRFNYFEKDNYGEYSQHCSVVVVGEKMQAVECSDPGLVE
ncbi:hypothetical protein [Atopomonas sediminilitoris]|uniref:hypothetical protein n=1 Tax=Atopomonas sediminilitoris TaxID=2919919 RepID=UPI001F4D67BB|nr:hypothetical protein [Atopomonas sediminilitoris]MCJ8170433.1 hypothetical protein [Atopomonas sediminilitoris]